MWVWNQKAKVAKTKSVIRRVTKKHDKDVLDVKVKRDVPQLVKLHFVAGRASMDKHRPEPELWNRKIAYKLQ